MTTGATAPPRVPTPRVSKAPPTSSLSSETVAASNTISASATTPLATSSAATPVSRAGTPAARATSQPGGRRGPRSNAVDPLSERATAALIRRVLCPEQQQLDKGKDTSTSIEDLLPPLTSRNDVDLQLYAIIAIILREYVQKWYNKITPGETFVAETVQIIAHCTRALEQRLRKVDLESLLFDEIPDLLDKHVNAYRVAHSQVAQPPIQTDAREIYHSMWPLPALSPVLKTGAPSAVAEQAENEAAYRQLLVQGVLALLLPTEDLENDCLTALVGQILSELIIGNVVANRLAEPWLIWECLIILSSTIRRRTGHYSAQSSTGTTSNCEPTTAKGWSSIQGLFLTLLQWGFLAANLVRLAVAAIVSSSSIPRRTHYSSHADGVTRHKTGSLAKSSASLPGTHAEIVKVPVLAFRIWPAISNLIELDLRMPWLSGTVSFLQWAAMTGPGKVADVDGVLDRYLSHSVIQHHLLDAATIPPLLRSIRGALFPNNAPGASTLKPPSTNDELLALRRTCASSIWALVPSSLGNIYFGRISWPWRSAARQHQRSVAGDRGPGLGATQTRVAQLQQLTPDGPRPPGQSDPPTGGLPRSGPRSGDIAAGARGGDDGNGLAQSGQTASARLQQAAASTSYGEDAARPPVGPGGGSAGSSDRDEEDGRILGEIESGVLDVFSDAYCNKHLVYGIVELVLVRLMPELAERGVIELLEERLS